MPGTHRPTASKRPPADRAASASPPITAATWAAAASPPALSMAILATAEISPSRVNRAEAILVPPMSTAPQKMGTFLFFLFIFASSTLDHEKNRNVPISFNMDHPDFARLERLFDDDPIP